jgi:zinc and cadmium transporter
MTGILRFDFLRWAMINRGENNLKSPKPSNHAVFGDISHCHATILQTSCNNATQSFIRNFMLTYILLTCLAGGVVSVLLATAIAWRAHPTWIPTFVSFAVGTLLGAVFLELLPHIFETAKSYHTAAAQILGGILLFFVMEKLVLWRHSHDHGEVGSDSHAHDHGRSGLMITIGDTVHNFTDGIVITAAFMADFKLGAVTAFAIIAHEIPQEIGDFLILIHSGYSKKRALMLNLLSSLANIVGAVLAYFALQHVQEWIPLLLSIAAASMIYVAVADLIPGLHKRTSLSATLQQIVLIGLGLATIIGVHLFFE